MAKKPILRHIITGVAVALCTLVVLAAVFPIPASHQLLAIRSDYTVVAQAEEIGDTTTLSGMVWDAWDDGSEAEFTTDGMDYRQESRPWHTVVKKELDESRPLYYEAEGQFISFKPVSISSEKTQPTLSTKETDLVFEGVWPDAAIVIEISRDHWKKLIRIDKAPITAAEYVDYVFEVETSFKIDRGRNVIRMSKPLTEAQP